MITPKRQIGNLGEKLAEEYLKAKGYRIVDRNYLWREGEIDLITEDKETLVFVEVKTRAEIQYSYPEKAVDYQKQKKLFKTAQKYLQNYKGSLKNYRLDVISVEINKKTKRAKIRQFENVLY